MDAFEPFSSSDKKRYWRKRHSAETYKFSCVRANTEDETLDSARVNPVLYRRLSDISGRETGHEPVVHEWRPGRGPYPDCNDTIYQQHAVGQTVKHVCCIGKTYQDIYQRSSQGSAATETLDHVSSDGGHHHH